MARTEPVRAARAEPVRAARAEPVRAARMAGLHTGGDWGGVGKAGPPVVCM